MGSASSTSLLLWAASFVARAASNAVEFETRERLGPGDSLRFKCVSKLDGSKKNLYKEDLRFLFLAGRPLKEPIARHGPFVMNTREELLVAFKEYQQGTFIKKKGVMIRKTPAVMGEEGT